MNQDGNPNPTKQQDIMTDDGNRTWKKFVKGIVIALSVITALFLILAYLGTFKMCAKSKQSEAKTNLKAIFTCEMAYFSDYGCYTDRFDDMSFRTSGKAKMYTFYLTRKETVGLDASKNILPDDIKPFANKTSFMAVAVGNIDDDQLDDIWTITDKNELKNLENDMAN